ncbi:MAG: DUF2851 family protein [SAR324 cluster bacterium]|nr:DUF2851 family protein [SAR324 cluster bacterium]
MPEKQPPEQLLQALWCLPIATEFRTTTGELLRVEFPGWLNSGAGPDFLEARLCLGDQQLYGAVEFHTHTRLWQVHGHPNDPAYQQVILHVVLYHDPRLPPLVRDDGQTIPVVELATQLPEKWEQLVPDGAALLKEYERLPGHCGSLLPEIGQQRLRLLLQEATEQRLQQKRQPIQQAWDTAEPEELLHRALFAALGAPTGAPPLPSCYNGYLGRLYNRGYVNLRAALVLSCWLAGLGYVDCFRRLHQMLQTCTENTPTGARSGNAWRIPIT